MCILCVLYAIYGERDFKQKSVQLEMRFCLSSYRFNGISFLWIVPFFYATVNCFNFSLCLWIEVWLCPCLLPFGFSLISFLFCSSFGLHGSKVLLVPFTFFFSLSTECSLVPYSFFAGISQQQIHIAIWIYKWKDSKRTFPFALNLNI